MTGTFAVQVADSATGTVQPPVGAFDEHTDAQWWADNEHPGAVLVLIWWTTDSGDVQVTHVRDAGRWQEVRPA